MFFIIIKRNISLFRHGCENKVRGRNIFYKLGIFLYKADLYNWLHFSVSLEILNSCVSNIRRKLSSEILAVYFDKFFSMLQSTLATLLRLRESDTGRCVLLLSTSCIISNEKKMMLKMSGKIQQGAIKSPPYYYLHVMNSCQSELARQISGFPGVVNLLMFSRLFQHCFFVGNDMRNREW